MNILILFAFHQLSFSNSFQCQVPAKKLSESFFDFIFEEQPDYSYGDLYVEERFKTVKGQLEQYTYEIWENERGARKFGSMNITFHRNHCNLQSLEFNSGW